MTWVKQGSSIATSTTGHTYTNEYAIFADVVLQRDGRYRVRSVKEFVDSKVSIEFFAAENKRQQASKMSRL